MGVIFGMSAQTAEESAEVSNSIGQMLGKIFVQGYEDWSVEEQKAMAEKIEHPIRKCAHAMEYALLGFLLVGAICDNKDERRSWNRLGLCMLIGALYACSDELHQTMVPGRAGQLTDVLIDSVGVIVGVMIARICQFTKVVEIAG